MSLLIAYLEGMIFKYKYLGFILDIIFIISMSTQKVRLGGMILEQTKDNFI